MNTKPPRLYFFVSGGPPAGASASTKRPVEYVFTADQSVRRAFFRGNWHPITRDRFYREAPADLVIAMLQDERGRPTQT